MGWDGMGWDGMGWDGIFKDHQVPLPDQFRADQKLKHVIKDIMQIPLDFENIDFESGRKV